MTIVVVAWNGLDFLPTCLDALRAQTYTNHEVLVVDNASTDGSPDLVAARYPWVRLIRNEHNRGFAGGVNDGVLAASGRIIALVNQDAVVQPDWLAELCNGLRSNSTVGIVGSKVLYPDHITLQHAGGVVRLPTGLTDHLGYRQSDRPAWDVPVDCDYVTGAACAIRREVFDAIGLFDEGFFPVYYEEVDFCWRARQHGFRVRYVPSAIAVHHESSSLADDRERFFLYFHSGRLRFIIKHWPPEYLRDVFLPAEVERVQRGLVREEYRMLVPAYRRAVQRDGDAMIYQQDDAHSPSKSAPTNFHEVRQAIDQLVDAVNRCLPPEQMIDPLAEYYQRMAASSGLVEAPFQSTVPFFGPLIVRFRQAWNWMATKWYVQPIIRQQNQFNAAVLQSTLEICHRLGKNQLAIHTIHSRLDTLASELEHVRARLVQAEDLVRQSAVTSEQVAAFLDQAADSTLSISETEATLTEVDRQVTRLSRELALLSLRLHRIEHPDDAATARRWLETIPDPLDAPLSDSTADALPHAATENPRDVGGSDAAQSAER